MRGQSCVQIAPGMHVESSGSRCCTGTAGRHYALLKFQNLHCMSLDTRIRAGSETWTSTQSCAGSLLRCKGRDCVTTTAEQPYIRSRRLHINGHCSHRRSNIQN